MNTILNTICLYSHATTCSSSTLSFFRKCEATESQHMRIKHQLPSPAHPCLERIIQTDMEGSVYKEFGHMLDSRYGVRRDESEEWRKFNSDMKQHRWKRERIKCWWVTKDERDVHGGRGSREWNFLLLFLKLNFSLKLRTSSIIMLYTYTQLPFSDSLLAGCTFIKALSRPISSSAFHPCFYCILDDCLFCVASMFNASTSLSIYLYSDTLDHTTFGILPVLDL